MLLTVIRNIACAVLLVGVLLAPIASPAAAETTGTLFKETGFRIANASFQDFFDHRGGVRTFGYPVSRECTLFGSRVQFFQRAIMQLRPDKSVTTLNFLDAGLMPYTRINNSVFPGADPALLGKAPAPGSANYDHAIFTYIRATAVDSWQSLPVKFYQTFASTVTAKDAFGSAGGPSALLPGFNLELWGAPTSAPAFDPSNKNFVYQRFQRGIMHYDKATGTTQGLLLAEYLKRIITGLDLPSDLEADAKSSPLYCQYDPSQPGFIARPADLPNSDLTMAFEIDGATTPSSRSGARPNPTGPNDALKNLTPAQMAFMNEAIPLAQASQRTFGIPASVTLAQTILETGYGVSELAVRGKNFFGIKAHRGLGPAGAVTIITSEYTNGQWIKIPQDFRAYHTMAESFEDHGHFLKGGPHYAPCFQTTDPKEWCRQLQLCGYATDPTYTTKLVNIMDKLNLYHYDVK